jgi:hypothetical protein
MSLWGKTDTDAAKPKYLSDELRNDQDVSDKDSTIGVNITEAQVTANIAKGIKTPGWTLYTTYTDSQGNTRNKAEVLVAMNQFAADGSDNDTIAPEITITVQPTAQTVFSAATATFGPITATRTGTGTITYQWQKQESGTGAWSNINGATATSYTTGVLTVAADNTDKYRVIASLTGADSVTSTAVAVTVNPAVITIGTQPLSASVTAGQTAQFIAAATATGSATVSYQWQKSDDAGANWNNIVSATNATYTTGVLTVVDDNNDQYRVIVSANKEATAVNSSAATLTVSP